MPEPWDAVVVGGGHNGLTAAAYLARAGLSVCVLERRHILGGACVTEEVWPGQRVSRASYVVSMLHPQVVSDLRLKHFGYRPIPLDPAYATITPDGVPVFFHNDPAAAHASIARVSRRDAEAYPRFAETLERAASFLRPMLLRPPPALGSREPGDVLALLREAARAAGLPRRELEAVYRLMTMSVADLLDDWFENDALKGCWASTGVVGVWAGPRTPGTAYNLLHHALGEIDGVGGLWGHVRGGMGAISEAIARSARAAGATIRTGAGVQSIDVCDGRVTGVTLAGGERLAARMVISGAHPQTTLLDLVGSEHLPEELAADVARYRTRGGSVKINCVLEEPLRYVRGDEAERRLLAHTGVALCPSIDHLERAWQDAVRGIPAASPYVEVEVPTSVDPSLSDDGSTVMTMFTQYGPPGEDAWGAGTRERYAAACLDVLEPHAPGVLQSVRHMEVLAPPDLERIFGLRGGSIFQGEQGLDQMAFMRPSPLVSQYATPVDGLYLCGAGTHPGGGVMAASGHNAAQRVLRDVRRRRAGSPRAWLRAARTSRSTAGVSG